MENVLSVAMWALFGSACAYFAKKQKRNMYLWFFIGLLLGIFGLLLLLMLPMLERFFKKDPKSQPAEKPQAETTIDIDTKTLKPDPLYADILWYFLDEEKQQVGPMSFQALEKNWSTGKVKNSTYLWNEKLTEWKMLSELFPLNEVKASDRSIGEP